MFARRVLATDMKQHLAFTSQFNNVHQKTIGLAEMGQPPPPGPPTPLDNNERLLSLQMALKVADLGSTMEGHEVRLGDVVVPFFFGGTGTRLCPLVFHAPQANVKWVKALEEEFFAQGGWARDSGSAAARGLTDPHRAPAAPQGIARGSWGCPSRSCLTATSESGV